MKFWVVTTSYNQAEWIALCMRSVADQSGNGISVHHHIQDACSKDGTVKFLEEWADGVENTEAYSFSYSSEADDGMYDAINRGWRMVTDDVDVLAHLNCDEQYLPEALKTIAGFFESNRKVDIAVADMIVVDQFGDYICHRRALKPHNLRSLVDSGVLIE